MIRMRSSNEWEVRPLGTRANSRKRRSAVPTAGGVNLPKEFLLPDASVAEEYQATTRPSAPRRGGPPPALDFEADTAPDERVVVAVRHPSGAITFHASVERIAPPARRSRNAPVAPARTRFVIPLRPSAIETDIEPARRGGLAKVVNFALIKIKEKLIDEAVSLAASAAIKGIEWAWWKTAGRQEGWFHITPETLRSGKLVPVKSAELGGSRALLLIHGTFSHAASAFKNLADGDFFTHARALYGDRIFAFNHYTLSRTPEENVVNLLKALPAAAPDFDVITHSRGGLVLRHAVECPDLFGAAARRFRPGHAVLVAAPNAGTPWVTPGRWEQTVGVVANLLELFPIDNPWTDGAAFVANGLVWIAGHVAADFPGLSAMDADGEIIAALQKPPGPAAGAYSALVANSNPSGNILARIVDAGIDSFFAGANDFVVPSEGGWCVDPGHGLAIPAERVGCFGPGGNLTASSGDLVQHLNFFKQRETTDFLLRALRGQSHGLASVDIDRPLPTRKSLRGGAALPSAAAVTTELISGPQTAPAAKQTEIRVTVPKNAPPVSLVLDAKAEAEGDNTLRLLIMNGGEYGTEAQIVAIYGNACVFQPFPTRNQAITPRLGLRHAERWNQETHDLAAAGTRFQEIIKLHERIRLCLAGEPEKRSGQVPDLPDDAELRRFGALLFDALFCGDVKRLYDTARSEQRECPLNVVLLCTIPWITAKPWEFAFDPSRRKFLVTEEVHFIRNVLTCVPAQRSPLTRDALRILVVVAQPAELVALSVEREEERIRHGFRALTDAGLVELDVLTDATPARLHGWIQSRELETRVIGRDRRYHIVHFIGHGDYDNKADQGKLLFKSSTGGAQEVDVRTLREILCCRGIQLVFLNACDTARTSGEHLNRGVAQGLVEGGLPAVVANQYKVLDPSAVAFAEHFYWSLAHGASLGEAAREARIALNYSLEGVVIDWAVPVIHASNPDFRICQRLAARKLLEHTPYPAPPGASPVIGPVPGPISPSAPSSRSLRALAISPTPAKTDFTGALRIAVADMAQVFPDLCGILGRWNQSQSEFQFRLVDIAPPLSVWRVRPGEKISKQRKDSGYGPGKYLDADRFAPRLKDKPCEVGAAALLCLIPWPMVCNMDQGPMWNVNAWWPVPKGDPVMLFSFVNLNLPTQGEMAELVLTNFLVGTLVGYLLAEDPHSQGPNDCPRSMYPEVRQRMRFDKACGVKLRTKLSKAQVSALESLLAAAPLQESASGNR